MTMKTLAALGASLGFFLAPSRAADTEPAQPEKPTTVAPSASSAAEAREQVRPGTRNDVKESVTSGKEKAADAKSGNGNGNGARDVNEVIRNFRNERERYLNTQRELTRELGTANEERRRQIREELNRLRDQIATVRREANAAAQEARDQIREQTRRVDDAVGGNGNGNGNGGRDR